MCKICFLANVQFQLSDGQYQMRGRKIVCLDCNDVQPYTLFDDEVVLLAIIDHKLTFDLFLKARDDAIIREQLSIKQRELEALDNEIRLLKIQLGQDLMIKHEKAVSFHTFHEKAASFHTFHILNNLLTLKCPHCTVCVLLIYIETMIRNTRDNMKLLVLMDVW